MSSRLLTTRDVAEILSVSPETVLRRVRRGELPAFRIGTNALRFDRCELQAWLERHRERRPQLVAEDEASDVAPAETLGTVSR